MKNDKAIFYIRVSTDEQAGEERFSLGTQSKTCRGAIDRSDYSLAVNGEYSDAGKSGTNMNRPGLQDLLIRIQEDKTIGALFVQDTDRLARNTTDHLAIKALLKKYDVKLISVSQPGIEDSPEGNLMDTIIAGMNQFQSQLTGRKTQKSLEEKFRLGWFPGRAPIGYINVGDKDNDKKRVIIVDPERGALVQEMFKLYSTGHYTLNELRDLMPKKGLLNFSGRRLARSQISKMLDDPFYFGEMKWKDMTGMGNHPPLVSKELYLKCKAVKAEHNGFRCRKRKYNFLLRGFIYCGYCEKRWTAEYNKIKGKGYYRCNRQSESIHCTEKYIEDTELEKQIEKKFSALEMSSDFIERIISKAQNLYLKEIENYTQNKESYVTIKNNCLKQLDTAEEKLISGVLTDDAYLRIKEKVIPRIESADSEIAKLDKVKTLRVDVIQKLLGLIRDLGKSYKKAPMELKRVYLGLFWNKFIVSQGKVQEAIPADIISELINLGLVTAKDENIALQGVSEVQTVYVQENIKIRTIGVPSAGIEPTLTA